MFETIISIVFLVAIACGLSYGGISMGLGAFKPRDLLTNQQRRNMWLLVAAASIPGFFVLPLFMLIGAPIVCICSFRFIGKYTWGRSIGAGLVAAMMPLVGAFFGIFFVGFAMLLLASYPVISAIVVGPIVLLAAIGFTMKQVQARRYAALAEA